MLRRLNIELCPEQCPASVPARTMISVRLNSYNNALRARALGATTDPPAPPFRPLT